MIVNRLKSIKFAYILIYGQELLTSILYLTDNISDIWRLNKENNTLTNSRIYYP